MNQEKFVEAIKDVVVDGSIQAMESTLLEPPEGDPPKNSSKCQIGLIV